MEYQRLIGLLISKIHFRKFAEVLPKIQTLTRRKKNKVVINQRYAM